MFPRLKIGLPSPAEKEQAMRSLGKGPSYVARVTPSGAVVSERVDVHDPLNQQCLCNDCNQRREMGKALISPRKLWEKR